MNKNKKAHVALMLVISLTSFVFGGYNYVYNNKTLTVWLLGCGCLAFYLGMKTLVEN